MSKIEKRLEELVGENVLVETFCADLRGKLVHRGTSYGFLPTPTINLQFHQFCVHKVDVSQQIITLDYV